MKLTRHNGRSGKNGTYNPRHNDRRFNVENSEHIDAERAQKNIYWDCYRGFTTHDFRENPEQPDYSFEEIERIITPSIIPTMWTPRTPGTRKPGTRSATALWWTC